MEKVFTITEDGSQTIYLPEMDEHYHSTHGALNESLHVYIEQGLLRTAKTAINILEIGFGTGLNAFLTFCFAQQNDLSINYYSLEKYPLSEAEYSLLNYPEQLFSEHAPLFRQLHEAEWDSLVSLSANFKLKKIKADLLTFDFSEIPSVDLVYYDAFAPSKQPEMWSDQILHKVAAKVSAEGILVTYCARGSVRRALSDAGFIMERIPGPKGKKEILRGKKSG